MSRVRVAFQGRKGAVLSVSLIVWALALFDLTLVPRKPPQYLVPLPPERLANVTVTPESLLMTSTNPASPASLWVLSRRNGATGVVGVQLPPTHYHREAKKWTLKARLRTTLPAFEGKPIDVEVWPGAGPALFAVSSPRRSPLLRVFSLRTGQPLLESKVPLPPQRSDRRDFFVARWSGPRPDLFVIDRDANRRRARRAWSIRIYTGESDFKKVAFETTLRKRLSRQLSERDWWLDVGLRRQPEPNLVLVTKGGRTGTGQTEVHVLSGRSRFRRFTLHSGTEFPDGLTQPFVFQSESHGGAVLMAKIRNDHLSLVPVPLP